LLSFVGVVVETAMNVTFPTLMTEFGINTSTVQWVTTGYLLMLAIIIPASSFLNKRFKMKTIFTAAIILFAVGTLLGAWAPAFGVLLAGRVLQGIGTGIALPLMYNIILEQAPEDKTGFIMGIASLVCALAPAVGPSFGGVIVKYLGWRDIFWALLPVVILAGVFGITSIRQATKTEKVSFDLRSYLFLALGFVCLVFGLSLAGTQGFLSASVLGLFAATVVFLAAFVWSVRKSSVPLIHLDVFRYDPFVFGLFTLVLIQFVCLGLSYLIPNYSQLVSGTDSLAAGCILLPGCILGAILNPISGKILDKKGARLPMLIGTGCMVVCLLLFALLLKSAGTALLAVIYAFFGTGQGFGVGTTQTHSLTALPEQLSADGTAVITTLQQLAGAIGTAVVTAIVEAAQEQTTNLAAGTQTGSVTSAWLLLVLSVLLFLGACRSSRKSAQ